MSLATGSDNSASAADWVSGVSTTVAVIISLAFGRVDDGLKAARWQLTDMATGTTTTRRHDQDANTGSVHEPVHEGLSATPTGLEPATSAVTGRRSNQLSYGA